MGLLRYISNVLYQIKAIPNSFLREDYFDGESAGAGCACHHQKLRDRVLIETYCPGGSNNIEEEPIDAMVMVDNEIGWRMKEMKMKETCMPLLDVMQEPARSPLASLCLLLHFASPSHFAKDTCLLSR